MGSTKTLTVSKLSQLQKIILSTLYSYNIEHNWESVPQHRLTRDIAEQYDRVEHVDRNKVIQKIMDHAPEVLRKADTREERDLLVKLWTSYINSIPKRGRHFVNDSTRASISRSIRRLEQRGLIEKSLGWIKLKVSLSWFAREFSRTIVYTKSLNIVYKTVYTMKWLKNQK